MAKTKFKTMPLHQLLKQLRKEKGLSLTLAAAYARIDNAILSKIESNKRKPTLNQLSKLAAIYEADIEELFILHLAELIEEIALSHQYGLSALKLALKKATTNSSFGKKNAKIISRKQ